MEEVVRLFDAAGEVIEQVKRVGIREVLGLEEVPADRPIDPEKCKCGGGCESLLECSFWHWLRKTREVERGAYRQVKIGRFRVDALIECDGVQVVVELDGKQWHQGREREDWERDKVLLETFDAVIRIPYSAMTFFPHGTFSVLGSWYPRFQLPAVSHCCMKISEFNDELKMAAESGSYYSDNDFVEQVDPIYEIWIARETFGWVGSPKAWMNQWNVRTIKRFLNHNRPPEKERTEAA